MFTLLSPSALLALSGLLVPVAIHLWNRRPGREVAVGSLRWLEAGANRRLRNLKPEQLWLLLLRATLLAVLAVGLAGPVWRQVQPAGRGQVLIGPELIGTPAFAASRPTIDSLRRRGYGLRWLAREFPQVPRAALRADSLGQRDSARLLAAVSPSGSTFTWARVQQAASTFPGQPLYVLTPASLRGFQGTQPALPANVTWQLLPTAATETWLQAAALRGDSLRLLVGRSNETQTTFRVVSVVRPRPGGAIRVPGLPPLRYETAAAGSRLQPLSALSDAGGKQLQPIAVRTRPLRITIYSTADYAQDVRVFQAGIRAASAGLAVPVVLNTTTTLPNASAPPDWLFWLTDAPLPPAWLNAVKAGTRVWHEAPGPGVATTAHLVVAEADELPAAIFRRGAPQQVPAWAAAGFPLWLDGQGRAVLARQGLGEGALYQLATRLSPTWSELADNPSLPARLLALLQPEMTDESAPAEAASDQALAAHDQRALDPAQIRFATKATSAKLTPEALSTVPPSFRQSDLRPWLVLAAGLLFALERLLARRRQAQAQPITL